MDSASRAPQAGNWRFVLPALAVAALLLNGLGLTGRKSALFFLDAQRTKLFKEMRLLPLAGTPEERARTLAEELLLGPMNNKAQPLFAQEARLDAAFLRGQRLSLALEIPDFAGLDAPFSLIRSAFEKTIKASVPGLGALDIYINGRLAEN